MTVRWRPMIVLSALFVLLAAAGVFTIITAMLPGRTDQILSQAREETKAQRYDRAKVQYGRALQQDPKNAAIHQELAAMLEDWSKQSDAQRTKLRPERMAALQSAAKYDAKRPGPRRILLEDALRREELGEAARWAGELLPLEPENPDALYVSALEALDRQPPNLGEAQQFLTRLRTTQADPSRGRWVEAQIARASDDATTLAAALTAERSHTPATDPSDLLAHARLLLMDLQSTTDPAELTARLGSFERALTAIPIDAAAPGRVRAVSSFIGQAQLHLAGTASRQPGAATAVGKLEESFGTVADGFYKQALETTGEVDLRTHLAYAEYLLSRDRRDEAMAVTSAALKRPMATIPAWIPTAMELREIAIKTALSDPSDPQRFERASPYIHELLTSTNARYQALGNLFQGLVELERSGLATTEPTEGGLRKAEGEAARLANSAVTHLEQAAAGLPDVATAQALCGVALILTRDPALGRIYLQKAQRLGGEKLDPRYQVWVAWSVLQAGYPEEAAPIVERLFARSREGQLARELVPTLLLLQAEIHQSRRTPESLKLARQSYEQAIAAGLKPSASMQIRLAKIDGQVNAAGIDIGQLEALTQQPGAGPAAEQLVITTLNQRGDLAGARKRLAAARARFPEDADLVALDAAMKLDAKQAREAEATVAEFLSAHPKETDLILLRAKILAGPLAQPEQARQLLVPLGQDAENSVPLVQLALIDLERKDYEAVGQTIATIRRRWSESSAADLLEAQLAFSQRDLKAASTHLDAAIAKDPNNKVALYWKAQLDQLSGSDTQAREVFESIVKDQTVKEIDRGLPLAAAAQWSLATMAMENRDYDAAIARFEALLRDSGASELARVVRWKLATARAAKGDVARAKAEVLALLNDPKTTLDERTQAADFYRAAGDEKSAEAQLDLVLKAEPTNPAAVAYRALLWASQGKATQAAASIRAVIDGGTKPNSLFLVLAVIENQNGPDGRTRALAALQAGLEAEPDSAELLRARYELLVQAKDPRSVTELEALAKATPGGAAQRLLVEAYRADGQYDKAAATVQALVELEPAGSSGRTRLAAQRIEILLAQAAALSKTRPTDAAAVHRQAATLVEEARQAYPQDLRFPQFAFDLAIRDGDTTRASRVAQELSDLDPKAEIGPLLLARMAASAGRADEATSKYAEALKRNPSRADIRVEYGQALLLTGQADEALAQAKLARESDREGAAALLLQAQALAAREGDGPAAETGRREAIDLLQKALAQEPKFREGSLLLSEIYRGNGDRKLAADVLEASLKAVPEDDAALAALIQRLVEPATATGKASAAAPDLARAGRLADRFGGRADGGRSCLAIAIGYHKGGQTDLALPWAEKAAGQSPSPVVHLTFGDILLAEGESGQVDRSRRVELLERAVGEYDVVLKAQPTLVEAVNNKAWILHAYLDRNGEALTLAEGLAKATSRDALPAEFLDTLGSIQEAAGKPDDARQTYADGLRKAPEHPVLNYHMGRLLAARPETTAEARRYLEVAARAKKDLPGDLAVQVDELLERASR